MGKFNSLHAREFACFLLSADFFRNKLFQKFLSGTPAECQTVWIQIKFRSDLSPNCLQRLSADNTSKQE